MGAKEGCLLMSFEASVVVFRFMSGWGVCNNVNDAQDGGRAGKNFSSSAQL